MQVYRDLPILTAQPSEAAKAAAPHRLYGFLALDDVCSADRWATLARQEIDAAHEAGKLPILCGGTGLYLRALMQGFSPIPDVPRRCAAGGARLCWIRSDRRRCASGWRPVIRRARRDCMPTTGSASRAPGRCCRRPARPISEWQTAAAGGAGRSPLSHLCAAAGADGALPGVRCGGSWRCWPRARSRRCSRRWRAIRTSTAPIGRPPEGGAKALGFWGLARHAWEGSAVSEETDCCGAAADPELRQAAGNLVPQSDAK